VSGGLTPGDPLGGDEPPRREPAPAPAREPARDPLWAGEAAAAEAPPRPSSSPGEAYGAGRVPPGAFATRDRGTVDPLAGARPASWGQRAIAAIVDAVLVSVVVAIVLGVLGALAFGSLSIDGPGGVAGAIVIGLIAVGAVTVGALVYAPLIMARTNGKTVGKMVTGCRVVRGNGRPVDLLWAAYREVLIKSLAVGIVGSITAGIGYLVNFLWPLFDDRNRAVHDIVVDSVVVKD
jgi:uncharacterized RDD family membrane protein YckC